jgi:hypothetical protein
VNKVGIEKQILFYWKHVKEGVEKQNIEGSGDETDGRASSLPRTTHKSINKSDAEKYFNQADVF